MKPLSPMGARRSLAYSEKYDTHLAIGHRRALETIANMREEWGAALPDGRPVGVGWGTYDTALKDMNAWRRDGYDARIVRRYTTEPEEA